MTIASLDDARLPYGQVTEFVRRNNNDDVEHGRHQRNRILECNMRQLPQARFNLPDSPAQGCLVLETLDATHLVPSFDRPRT